MPHNNTPNPVLNIQYEPDSYPGLSYSSSPDPSDSLSDDYSNQRRRTKNIKNKRWSKTRFHDLIKKCANLTDNLPTAIQKSNVIKFRFDEDPLHHQVYFLSFMNSLNFFLSQFKETYILSMEYPSIRGEYFPDYAKNPHGTFCMHKYMHVVKYQCMNMQ